MGSWSLNEYNCANTSDSFVLIYGGTLKTTSAELLHFAYMLRLNVSFEREAQVFLF